MRNPFGVQSIGERLGFNLVRKPREGYELSLHAGMIATGRARREGWWRSPGPFAPQRSC
jgi:hypothetical protein